jgi:type I restriction enzyme S subunit
MADTAEDETAGKVSEITNIQNENISSGLHTFVCRPKSSFKQYFLGYYMNSQSYHHQLLPLMQGIKVLSLSRTNISKTYLQYPKSLEEQTAIGSFFQQLDTLINSYSQELDKLKNIKKALLEKMFV